MLKRTNEELERLFSVFKRGTLEDFFTLSGYLREKGSSPEELGRYLSWKRGQIQEAAKVSERRQTLEREKAEKFFAEWQEKVKKCPLCGAPLILSKITTLKGKSNKKGWRSLWSCPNEDCLFEEYSKEYADKIYTELMEGR